MVGIVTKADYIFEVFEKKLPNEYKSSVVRGSQVQMAMDILDFLQYYQRKKFMFVEAPVGTGKSLGALIPVLVNMKTDAFSKEKLIYATSTINLQGQLNDGELPLLKKMKLLDTYIVAKGKANYFCYRKWMHERSNQKFSELEKEKITEFFQWAESGQRSELEGKFGLDIDDANWKAVELTATAGECRRCQFSQHCPTRLHRMQFRGDNEVTVTNHDQLIQSFVSKMEDSFKEPILPVSPGILVIDEAHHFLENFIGRLERGFMFRDMRKLDKLMMLRKMDKVEEYKEAYKGIQQWIDALKKNDEGSGRYTVPKDIKVWLSIILRNVNKAMVGAKQHVMDQLDDWTEVLALFKEDSQYIHWLDLEDARFVAIPNSFQEKFREMLDLMSYTNKVIFMSGTLTVNGDFTSLMNQWWLDKSNVITKSFQSPFDYQNQAMIYVPDGLVNPSNDRFIGQAKREINRLLELTGGRTLLLNTSKEHMQAFHIGVVNSLKEKGITLYLQGDKGVEKLTKQFKEDETSVVVGSGSFFSGFSVSGLALTSVILNRLPFPVKDDPVLNLMGEGLNKDEYFTQITYHSMISKLNQAAGRLIRSISDYGIFTVLDSRIFTSDKYGKGVRDLLEGQGYGITRSWDDIKAFYRKKLENGAEAKYKPYKRIDIEVPKGLQTVINQERKASTTGTKVVAKEKVPKTRLTKDQRSFLEEFCKENGVDIAVRGNPESIYKAVYDKLYEDWRDVEPFKEAFPYRDGKEREKLSSYSGGQRRVFFPLCTKFGCTGHCSSENREKIEEYFQQNYDVCIQGYISMKTACRITLKQEDMGILQREEFRPDHLKV